jgi:hypothetical protein
MDFNTALPMLDSVLQSFTALHNIAWN